MYPDLHLRIGGQLISAAGRRIVPVINPANGERIGDLPISSEADLSAASAAADSAFASWSRVPPWDRGAVLKKAAVNLREAAEHIARVLVSENGKTLREARLELGSAADTVDWYGEEAKRLYGRTLSGRQEGARFLTFREPVGVVAAFAPWNFPAINIVRKVAPALAAGCTVVAKPAEETPATPLLVAECFSRAGLPDGALNIVYGVPAEVSRYLIASPAVKKISFTGSTAVGRQLAELAGLHLKRVTMELGGHGPVIVCADADPDRAAELAASAKFRNAGQVCNAASRFYVHRSLYDRFVNRFGAFASNLKVGDGLNEQCQMGSLSNPRRLRAMESFVSDALGKGATLVSGGRRLGDRGCFFMPTVLSDVSADAEVLGIEPFGPIAPIVAFDDLDDAIRSANRLPYGLAGYAITNDAATGRKIARTLKTGVVGLNTFVVAHPETPFGGVQDSGWGYEGGVEALDSYLNTKFVHEA